MCRLVFDHKKYSKYIRKDFTIQKKLSKFCERYYPFLTKKLPRLLPSALTCLKRDVASTQGQANFIAALYYNLICWAIYYTLHLQDKRYKNYH